MEASLMRSVLRGILVALSEYRKLIIILWYTEYNYVVYVPLIWSIIGINFTCPLTLQCA